MNQDIRAPRVFVVQDGEEALGEMDRDAALRAASSAGKDLVEIVPTANPPVVKIIEWSKFKYTLSKKKKSQKHKSQEQKELWFKAFIGDGDIDHKLKKVKEFIDDGQRVKLTIRRKGRVTPDAFRELMNKLIERTADYVDVLSPPKFEGGNYSSVLGPKKK